MCLLEGRTITRSRSYDLFNLKVDKKLNPDEVQQYRFELVDDEIKFGG